MEVNFDWKNTSYILFLKHFNSVITELDIIKTSLYVKQINSSFVINCPFNTQNHTIFTTRFAWSKAICSNLVWFKITLQIVSLCCCYLFLVYFLEYFDTTVQKVQSNLCTSTTFGFGTKNLWPLLTGGCCSDVALCYKNWKWDVENVVAVDVIRRWSLTQIWLYS